MKKRSALNVAAIFFLVQAILQTVSNARAESSILNPPSEINITQTESMLKSQWSAIRTALDLYDADVWKKLPSEQLIDQVDISLTGTSVRFHLDNIDEIRKGRVRCYPFSIGDKHFMALICPKEARRKLDVPVLMELDIKKRGVILQIFPGVNDILKGREIKPHEPPSPSPTDKSA